MKNLLKLGLGKVSFEGVSIENITVELSSEMTMSETVGSYGLIRKAISDLPEIINDLANAHVTYMEADHAISELASELIADKEAKHSMAHTCNCNNKQETKNKPESKPSHVETIKIDENTKPEELFMAILNKIRKDQAANK